MEVEGARIDSARSPAEHSCTVTEATMIDAPQIVGAAWKALDAWVASQGRTAAPSLWEVYLTDPRAQPDPATWRTELDRPLVG
jgi:effector-binding domain-containing protein